MDEEKLIQFLLNPPVSKKLTGSSPLWFVEDKCITHAGVGDLANAICQHLSLPRVLSKKEIADIIKLHSLSQAFLAVHPANEMDRVMEDIENLATAIHGAMTKPNMEAGDDIW